MVGPDALKKSLAFRASRRYCDIGSYAPAIEVQSVIIREDHFEVIFNESRNRWIFSGGPYLDDVFLWIEITNVLLAGQSTCPHDDRKCFAIIRDGQPLIGSFLKQIPQFVEARLRNIPSFREHKIGYDWRRFPAVDVHFVTAHVKYIRLKILHHVSVNSLENFVNPVASGVQLTAGWLDAVALPGFLAETDRRIVSDPLPTLAYVSRRIEFREHTNAVHETVIDDFADILLGVDLPGCVSPVLRHIRPGSADVREAVRIGYMPVEGIQFRHSHGLDRSEDRRLVDEVSRGIQQDSTIGIDRSVGDVRVSDDLDLVA